MFCSLLSEIKSIFKTFARLIKIKKKKHASVEYLQEVKKMSCNAYFNILSQTRITADATE